MTTAGGPRAFDARALGRTYDVPAIRAQRARTRELLTPGVGDTVLDLGCGPGHLTAEVAAQVGAAGRVLALDRQPGMLRATGARAAERGLAQRCALLLGDATALPLRTGSCDGAVVVQVLAYVADVAGVLGELHRVLRPGGRAVLVDTDWRSCVWHTEDRARTDRVLQLWEAHFVHPQLPAVLPGLARAAGLRDVAVHAVPVLETDPTGDTYSMGMAATIAAFVARRDRPLAEDWLADVRRQAEHGTALFSLTRFATVVTR